MNRRRRKKLSKRLVEAAAFGDSTRINALLRAGARPETSDTDGTTPPCAASVDGAADHVLCLLAAGASPGTDGPGAAPPTSRSTNWAHPAGHHPPLT